MLLTDVNILVYAFWDDAPDHDRHLAWLEDVVNGDHAFGMAGIVLSGFLRIVTHPRVFAPPYPMDRALQFIEAIRARPNCVPIEPGPRHWEIFLRLCRTAGVRGNLVPDAYLAAIAIESGSEWITTDRGYGRFPGLRWRVPW